MLQISTWKAIFRVEQRQPQEVCAVTLMMQRLDDNDVVSLCAKRKASVQNNSEKTKSDVDPNFLSTNKKSSLPSTVVRPSGKGAYLTFVNVQS